MTVANTDGRLAEQRLKRGEQLDILLPTSSATRLLERRAEPEQARRLRGKHGRVSGHRQALSEPLPGTEILPGFVKQESHMSRNIRIERKGSVEILYSYGVPVAAFVPGQGYIKTSKRYSVTTSKHANQYLRRNGRDPEAAEVPDTEFRALIDGASPAPSAIVDYLLNR